MAWLRRKRPDRRTDEALAEAYRATGEPGLLGILFDRYLELLYGLCLQYLKDSGRAEDAVMDIYEQLRTKLRKHEVGNVRPWLYRLARNHCLMLLRKRSSSLTLKSQSVAASEQLDLADVQLANPVHLDHEPEAQQRERLLLQLEQCQAQLPREQAECIRRFYLAGESYAEISAELAVPVGTVRSRIQNGRRNLKTCMNQNASHP